MEKGWGIFVLGIKERGVTDSARLRNLAKAVSKQAGQAAPRGRNQWQPEDSGLSQLSEWSSGPSLSPLC